MPGPIFIASTAAGIVDVPYLTTDEYINDPDAVDTSNLVPGGSVQQNLDVLFQKILQASGWMDSYVHYSLGATLDVEVMRCRVRVDGYVQFVARGMPIQEIESIKFGRIPSQMVSINPANYADIYAEENVVFIPAIVSTTATSSFGPGDKVYGQLTYVNGFANTLLANAPAAAATSLQVKSALAIYPGTQLVIYDLAKTETVTVAANYVGGIGLSSTTIPLASGLLFAHSIGVAISALPPLAKKAAILATSAFIKTRGGGAMIMDAIVSENPSRVELGEAGAMQDLKMAADHLKSYRNMYFA